MALWGMADKMALALAAGLTLPALQYFGFDPNQPTAGDGLLALKVTYCVVPLLFISGSILLIWFFPITRDQQLALRQRIQSDGIRLG